MIKLEPVLSKTSSLSIKRLLSHPIGNGGVVFGVPGLLIILIAKELELLLEGFQLSDESWVWIALWSILSDHKGCSLKVHPESVHAEGYANDSRSGNSGPAKLEKI